jgi:hypothetical protein
MADAIKEGNGLGPARIPLLSLGPSRRFTLADLTAVATGTAHLELEASALESLPVASFFATSVPATLTDSASSSLPATPLTCSANFWTVAETRAILVARLASLIQGRAYVRREILERMLVLLNDASTFPPFRKGHEVEDLQALLQQPHPEPLQPPLSHTEAIALRTGTYASTGPAALHAYAVHNLVSAADMAAAVACEVTHASLEPFQAVHFDMHRPHRGQMATAMNLRLLLEGSAVVRPAVGAKGGRGKENDNGLTRGVGRSRMCPHPSCLKLLRSHARVPIRVYPPVLAGLVLKPDFLSDPSAPTSSALPLLPLRDSGRLLLMTLGTSLARDGDLRVHGVSGTVLDAALLVRQVRDRERAAQRRERSGKGRLGLGIR